MHDEDLCFRSAVDLAADIRSRRISPVELARAVLARIEALNPHLNCFPDYVPSSSALRTRNAIVLESSSETENRRPSGRKRGFGAA